MDTRMMVAVLFRCVHILAAIVAVGGLFFMRFVLFGAAGKALDDDAHDRLRQALIRRWKPVAHSCIALLLLSGFYNFFTVAVPKGREIAAYHPIFGVKFLAALGLFAVSIAVTIRATPGAEARCNTRRCLSIGAALALLIVLLSAVLHSLEATGG